MQTARMPALAYPTPGALLLGDALNMRHPITGNGMTAALYDVVLIRDLLRPLDNLNNTLTVTKRVKRFYTMRKVSNMFRERESPNHPTNLHDDLFFLLAAGSIFVKYNR